MKKKIIVISLLVMVLVSRCTVISFYPLYTDDVLVLDSRIEGTWESSINQQQYGPLLKEKSIWEISKLKTNALTSEKEAKSTYKLKFYPKGEPEESAEFRLHLVKLGSKHFLDFYPEDFDLDNDLVATNIIPVHTFAKIEIKTGNLDIQWFNSDWLQKLFEQNKIRIRHEKNDKFTLLTAKPKELQQFVIKYADDPNAFKDGIHIELKKIK